MAIVKRRLIERAEIVELLAEALEITAELDPPASLEPQVFASALAMVGQHEVTQTGGIAIARPDPRLQ